MMKYLVFITLISLSLFANIGQVFAYKGKAEIFNDAKIRDVFSGVKVDEGDGVRTYELARVQVRLNDKTTLTVGPRSEFIFDEFLLDEKNSKVSMHAVRGFFRSVTGRIGKLAPQRFTVKTKTAHIGIRGTDFSGEISSEFERFSCYSGEIFIIYNGKTKTIKAGKFVEIRDGEMIEGYLSSLDSLNGIDELFSVANSEFDSSDIATQDISDLTQTEGDSSPNPTAPDDTYTAPFGINLEGGIRPQEDFN